MKQETLDLIGRRHTVEQVKETFRLARELGFDNINMDLIVGLPEEDEEDVRATMEEIKKLGPDSLTVHSLAIKRAARLNMFREKYGNLKITGTQEMIDMTARYAKEMGMEPYYLYRQKNMAGNFENVGYSTPARPAFTTFSLWRRADHYGLREPEPLPRWCSRQRTVWRGRKT